MKANEYKCAHCGNIYEKGWSDEEAKTEAKANFGKPIEEWESKAEIICDDCYKLMQPDRFPDLVKETKKHI